MQNFLRVASRTLVGVIAFIAVIALGLAMNTGTAATAQDSLPATITPRPSPTGNGGTATWTVKSMTFKSEYPNGGTFTIEANSSAGDINSATVFIQHQPFKRTRVIAKYDAASGTWIAKWLGQATPQWVAVNYYWSLSDAQKNVYQTDTVGDIYADNTREWKVRDSEDITVYWQATLTDDYADEIIAAMAAQREFYRSHWGTLLKYKPRAVIYDDYAAMAEWDQGAGLRNPGTGGVGSTIVVGRAYDAFGTFIGVARKGRSSPHWMAYDIVLHEIGHLYQAQNGGIITSGQIWFYEGNAEYFNKDEASLEESLNNAKNLAASGNLPPLLAIGRNGLIAYEVGYAFWKWLEVRFGDDIHLSIVQLCAKGINWQKALEQATGMSFLALETEFRAWLGAPNAVPPTTLPEPTLAFAFPSPTFAPTKTPKP
ncbi:MAG: hypothetical protein KF716_00265 [Anaerolineae bacterium]|nr:hypothetical protein [Anaerolineae bacterium]